MMHSLSSYVFTCVAVCAEDMVLIGDEAFFILNNSNYVPTWEEAQANCTARNMIMAEPKNIKAVAGYLLANYRKYHLTYRFKSES